MDAKEDIRARLNIEDVIGEYVQLKRAGRSFKGLSPFTSEKTPSFFVNPEKNIWHDFSSNKGGDVFAFVMEVEGMDFRAALEHLARKAGVDLSLYESQRSGDFTKRKDRIREAHRLAGQYYQHTLVRNKHALDYVTGTRKLTRETIGEFGLGYAPDVGTALTTYLKKKGFSANELSEAGLVSRYGKDMFRGRMMIPLMDPSGQTIGFTGRILEDVPGAPKYLNTPQTLVYDKGRHVFGLSQAKEAIRSSGKVVIVEGNLDVVSSHQAGVKQVVATAGTALTEHHLRALKRLTTDVRLAFDADKAGIAASERAIEIASPLGIELTIISMPEGVKDPDELLAHDVNAWRDAIEQAQPAVDWILAQYSERLNLKTAAGKREFTTTALRVIRTLGDPVESEHYQRKVAKMTDSSIEAVRMKLAQNPEETQSFKQVKAKKLDPTPDTYTHEDSALAIACIDPPSQELFAHVDADTLHGEPRRALARYFAKHHNHRLERTPEELQSYDDYVTIVLTQADARYAEWDGNERYYETARLLRQIENEHKKSKKKQLDEQLRDAEAQGDEATAQAVREQLIPLIKEIARGKR